MRYKPILTYDNQNEASISDLANFQWGPLQDGYVIFQLNIDITTVATIELCRQRCEEIHCMSYQYNPSLLDKNCRIKGISQQAADSAYGPGGSGWTFQSRVCKA